MRKQFYICVLIFAGSLFLFSLALAQENKPEEKTVISYGSVNANNINLRSDSNISSPIICTVSKGSDLEVVAQKYGWYKIRLPKEAPAYVHKSLVSPLINTPSLANKADTSKNDARITAKANKDNINIRLKANESSAIIGKLNTNEIITVVEGIGDWYRIEPTNTAFGWINSKFLDLGVRRTPAQPAPLIKPESQKINNENGGTEITIKGRVKPYGKVFKRSATHKLVADDNSIFLLKGDEKNLNALSYHKVKVTGKRISQSKQKYPLIEITNMEALD